IKILFTPDEEIGKGPDAVDLARVGAEFAYTVDGGETGGLETECFNAAEGTIIITGYNVHPGTAYGKMHNSLRLIPEIMALFPDEQAPETTKEHQAYYHPVGISGRVGQSGLKFLLRSFDATELDALIAHVQKGVEKIQQGHPEYKIALEISKSYRNMKEILDQYPKVVDIAKQAILQTGLQVVENPIRGGTDGARFSFRGMPTPNIFTGGYNFHSKKEFVSVLGMNKAVETILNIISLVIEIEK
ncbi:MAG: tripeptide aminopeptidase PepT, partial [Promethearchaeota archaeon]